MPRPAESPDVKASKGLSYILRHGAEKEGLYMRQDGYIKLNDVLARPKMREVDIDMVLRIVAENAKQRFELFYGIDPSPPRPPKLKKGQQPKKVQPPVAEPAGAAEAVGGPVDAANVEDLAKALNGTSVGPVELPLISLPRPDDESGMDIPNKSPDTVGKTNEGAREGEWFIRATQGHSIKLESNAHLEPVLNTPEGRQRAGECVHGTRWELWDTLLASGLSTMGRTHVHLAPALSDHIILPRPNSTLRIYLDVPKLIAAGIPLYTSLNGVVLTPGNDTGVVTSEYWRLAERRVSGEWVAVWRDGQAVTPS